MTISSKRTAAAIIANICMAAICAMTAAPAFAAPANLVKATSGYLYFNRPGASMAAHDSELRDCYASWQGGVFPGKAKSAIVATGIVDEAIERAVHDMMMAGWERARLAVNVEHCMVIRGWRVIRLQDARGKQLGDLDKAALAAALAPMVGATNPEGEVARTWDNDAALKDTIMVRSPQGADRTLLSALAMDTSAAAPQRRVVGYPHPVVVPTYFTPLNAGAAVQIPDGQALLILRMSGTEGGKVLRFERETIGANGQAAEIMFVSLRKVKAVKGRRETTLVYVAPPGRYRLFGREAVFDFCMGAPSFEVAAGEVVFMGEFNVGPQRLKPDMSLAPAQEQLTSAPDLLARLRPAAWTNGSTSPCRNWHPYALEFEGFPFEPGYTWGAAATN